MRFQKRLQKTAVVLATRPTGTLPQRCGWAELKGAYRLIHAVEDRPYCLQEVHRANTRARAEGCDRSPVLFIHDTTTLIFSDHEAVRDQLGPVNDSDACGFIQHNSLAVDPNRQVLLGLIYQQTFCREPKPAGETRAARYHRAQRESQMWLRGVEGVGRAPADSCWIHIGDRAADFFGMMACALRQNSHFLLRLVQNRKAKTGDSLSVRLMEAARSVAVTTTAEVHVASRGGRPARTASVCLGSTRLTIGTPEHEPLWRGSPPITLTVVRIWEPNPPEGAEGLEWIVGTDLTDQSAEALRQYQAWYEWRWPTMEDYHKAQKSGLKIEEIRFETRGRLQAAIALLSVVAVRILSLRWSRDSEPDAPADLVASPEEIEALAALRPQKPPVQTVKQFVERTAMLGGWLGRKCDGPPGWGSLWRGYQRLVDIVLGMELAKAPKPPQRVRCG
jgi:hypothetical protein